jgi:uncharacterized lipoprotein YehR (DUF1307 family)
MKKMTKVISLALALVMCLALCACGQKDSGDTAADGKKTFVMGVDPAVQLSGRRRQVHRL